jgi:hypothetical protein
MLYKTLDELKAEPGDIVMGHNYKRYELVGYNGLRGVGDYGSSRLVDRTTSTFLLVEKAVKNGEPPKEWENLSVEEKKDLLFAQYEGKELEYYSELDNVWKPRPEPADFFATDMAYRVKPEAELVEVKLSTANLYCGSWYHHTERDQDDIAEITFTLVDGEPDWTTLKGRKL